MDLFSELIEGVQSDLTIGDESTLFPLSTVKLALNRSYIKCGSLFKWPETEDAQKTDTQNGIDYYDYPDTFKPDSIWKLMVDDVDYGDPLSFKDYQYEIENISNGRLPCGKDYIWTSQYRRFFIYPTPTAAGTNNIVVWGFSTPEKLVDDSDITIWSYSMPECNEAIVLEAVGILKGKGEDDTSGQFRSAEAKQILVTAWNKVRSEQDKYKNTQSEFVIPDFFA